MAYLPEHSLELKGGCMCSAIRYTISIPSLADRPLAPKALPTPVKDSKTGDVKEVATRFPFVAIDHCDTCRRSSGALVQSWIVVQRGWTQFRIQPRQRGDTSDYTCSFDDNSAVRYAAGDAAVPSHEMVQETYLGAYRSSEHVVRTFCARCGTSISYCYDGDRGAAWTLGPLIDIMTGTLDRADLERVQVERQLWCNHGIDWIKKLAGVDSQDVMICHPDGSSSQKM